MANKQLSELTAAGSLTGSELVYVTQSGNSRRTTTGAIGFRYQGACAMLGTTSGAANRSASADAIAFDTLVYDTEGTIWTIANPTKLFVPTGWTRVRLTGQFGFGSITAETGAGGGIRKNGGLITPDVYTQMGSDDFVTIHGMTVSPAVSVTGGDYFELVGQTSGGDTSTTLLGLLNWLEMERLA
jgi:hypothetical protein